MEEDGTGGGVLLVEDHEATRYAMRYLLRTSGVHDVEEAATADEAIRLLSIGTHPPRCVLLDWIVPGGGAAVLGHVRKSGLPIKVIVLTVAYERHVSEIRAAGADAVFPKPIDEDAVLDALRACVRKPPTSPGGR